SLARELQDAVREGPSVARQIRDVDRFGPPIRGVVVHLTRTCHREESCPCLLDSAGLTACGRVVARLRVHHDAFFFHGGHAPSLEPFIRGMNEVRLAGRTDVRAEEDPRVRPTPQIAMTLQVRIHSEKSELVAAERDEAAVAGWLSQLDGADHLQPTDNPA